MADAKAGAGNAIVGMGRGSYVVLLAFFLGPAVIIYTVFSIYPLFATIFNSLYLRQPDGAYIFNGLGNFQTLLTDTTWSVPFWNAFRNNCYFFLIHMLVQNPIGLALAAMLSLPRLRLRATYRTLIFMPTMLSVVIIGFTWQLILSPLWGISKMFLNTFGLGFLFAPVAWPGIHRPHHRLADFRVAVRRHPDDPDLHRLAGDPRGAYRCGDGRWPQPVPGLHLGQAAA